MILPTPSAPFEHVSVMGEFVTIDVDFEFAVMYTGNPDILPMFNEYTLQAGRTLPPDGTYDFTNDYDINFGLKCINRNIISFYNSDDDTAYFYLFSHTPSKFSLKVENGKITQISIYPGNGLIDYGMISHPDLTRDSNANSVPDIIDPEFPGSIPAFLRSYTSIEGTPGVKILLLSTEDEIQTSNGLTIFVRGSL